MEEKETIQDENNLQNILGPEGMLEVNEISTKITKTQLNESLERLIQREVLLLKDPRFSDDGEMREITLWNVASLVAALNHVNAG